MGKRNSKVSRLCKVGGLWFQEQGFRCLELTQSYRNVWKRISEVFAQKN